MEVKGPASPDCIVIPKVGDKAHHNNCGKVSSSVATGICFTIDGAITVVVYTDLFCPDPKFNLPHEDSESVDPDIYLQGGTKKHYRVVTLSVSYGAAACKDGMLA